MFNAVDVQGDRVATIKLGWQTMYSFCLSNNVVDRSSIVSQCSGSYFKRIHMALIKYTIGDYENSSKVN